MDPRLYEDLTRYVRFGDEEAARLRTFHVVAAPELPRICSAFYERIREHQVTRAVLAENRHEAMHRSLRRWLDHLCLGPHDQQHFDDTSAIGRMHAIAALPHHYLFTGMALIEVELLRIADRMEADAGPTREAISRLLGVELAIMLEGYRAHDRMRSEQLRQTERLAAVGTLAAGLAHEIRNPLNGALLHVKVLDRALRRAQAAPESLEALEVVAHELGRLSRLVTDFLDFARPAPLHREATSLRGVCELVLDLVRGDAERAGAKLVTELPAGEVTASIDAARIQQVLLNLVRNAIEAVATQGGGKVTVRARSDRRGARIEVEDDGPGIPPNDSPIFDAFFTTKPGGTGLGLSIVHAIITQHDGDVEVESAPGRTVFRLTLPDARTD